MCIVICLIPVTPSPPSSFFFNLFLFHSTSSILFTCYIGHPPLFSLFDPYVECTEIVRLKEIVLSIKINTTNIATISDTSQYKKYFAHITPFNGIEGNTSQHNTTQQEQQLTISLSCNAPFLLLYTI